MNIPESEFMKLLKDKIYVDFNFSSSQLNQYKNVLDWKGVSSNQIIDWNYEMVKEFESYIDWETLQNNKRVTKRMTLGLLFPNRVELPKCHCSFEYDFCECEEANWYNGNWERGIEIITYKSTDLDFVIFAIINNLSDEFLEEILIGNFIDRSFLENGNITLLQ
jgi:hypothetical protein